MLITIVISDEYEVRTTVISGMRARRTCNEIADFSNILLRTIHNVKAATGDYFLLLLICLLLSQNSNLMVHFY